ncbi:MAG TPA: glutamyl-tRNA reductase [Acidobacteriaceae bacterium]|nr:glutamyl-tRNA reductase [Acidobacteriaceae bacterium]
MSQHREQSQRLTIVKPAEEAPLERGLASGTLVLVGVNHTTAPIEVRERLSIPLARLADAVRTLAQQPDVREAMVLSTCNRVEFLTHREAEDEGSGAALLRFLHEYFAIPAETVGPHLYEYRGREAVRHLFRVASSLDSMVVGEPQILGQVKEAYGVARGAGTVAAALDPLLQRAFSVAKRVRTETQIGSSSVSIASVAVDLARKIFGSLEGRTVLLVGAGKMSELAARHLIRQGATQILVANRTEERAAGMAGQIAQQISMQLANDPAAILCGTEVISWEKLHEQASRADIVITSTGAEQHIFTRTQAKEMLERRRNRPVFFIDIAVPRDVDPKVNDVEGCFVYDIDDLQQVAAAHLADRGRESAAAEKIVADEVTKYQQAVEVRGAVPAIIALQENAEALRRAELERAAKRLGPLTAEQREALDAMTRSLTAKLLHAQIVELRKKDE